MWTVSFCLAVLAVVVVRSGAVPPTTTNATPAPVAPSTQAPPPPAPFDDDFVPYNRSRHDEFDFKLIKAVLSGAETSNVILSPFSVKLLMSLLAEAAGPNTVTERELASVLPGVNNNLQARELYAHTLRSLQQDTTADYEFKIGTKIYASPALKPRQRFASIAELYYFTRIDEIDFADARRASTQINEWVAETTNNRIRELISDTDIDAQTALIMLNAIYFNGYWRRPFAANETSDGAFSVPGSQAAQRVRLMEQTDVFFYLESAPLDAKVLRMPYRGGRFAMTLLLPNGPDTPLDRLLERLDGDTLRRTQYFMDEMEVRVVVPRFRFDHTAALIPVLQRLGIESIFGETASLPLLSRGIDAAGRLKVSQIKQKAGIDVNESGSTAYAATDVVLTNRFGGDTTREFVATRPFVFLIEDESTGSMLFAGKVTNPAEFAQE